MLCILASLIFIQGCTSLSGGSPLRKAKIASSVNENEDMYIVGSAKVEDSGIEVARMKARTTAKEELKNEILKESKKIIETYLTDLDFYNKKLSDQIMTDLSEYVAEDIMTSAEEKSYWQEDGKAFVALSVKKDKIPTRTRTTFLKHLDGIMEKVKSLKERIESIPLEDQKVK
ncbi:hypothetical protein [uncultured Ilyobacter sp.]|uniref:hypothetical protein n=1 Tax=uncultured Ilyobacter sp. TaxID=544433 RepID=UPI0029C69C0B|nr:hypothetical protein [uncultured Ilyobacter sp.]